MKLKYVGQKEDGETAFSAETKITWFPGTVEEVPAALAERMLKHPDVFAVDDEPLTGELIKPLSLADAKAFDPVQPPNKIQLADDTFLKLDGLDKATLHAVAKENGVDVHHNAGADKVITALVAAFPVKPTE